MTEKEEIKSVIINGDNDAFMSLRNKHIGICKRTINDYSGALSSSGNNMSDIYDNIDDIIYDAIHKFDKNKNVQFNTFLGNHTRYTCLNYINKKNKEYEIKVSEEYATFLEIEKDSISSIDHNTLNKIINIIKNYRDKRAWDIFNLRYFDKKTWPEIGEFLGVSYERARQIHNDVIKFIRKYHLTKLLEI